MIAIQATSHMAADKEAVGLSSAQKLIYTQRVDLQLR